jgi:hypothetical protein
MNSYSPPRYGTLATAIALDGRPKYVIAGAAGISPNTLAAIISGRQEPNERCRARLAAELGLAAEELFA